MYLITLQNSCDLTECEHYHPWDLPTLTNIKLLVRRFLISVHWPIS